MPRNFDYIYERAKQLASHIGDVPGGELSKETAQELRGMVSNLKSQIYIATRNVNKPKCTVCCHRAVLDTDGHCRRCAKVMGSMHGQTPAPFQAK